MLRNTKEIRVIVLTEYWSKGYKREDGVELPEGWRKPKGWPARASQREDGDINDFSRWAAKHCHECSLYQALTHHASSPAFLVGYKPTKIGLRLRKDSVRYPFCKFIEDAGGIHMHLAMFDVDCHEETVDIEAWWESELDKIAKLQDDHQGVIVYRSRRGYRILSLLQNPIHLKTSEEDNQWVRTYTAWVNYLLRVYSIKADKLTDWTRFQGVPHTKKDRDKPALDLEILGDVEHIGVWEPKLEASDYPPERFVSHYEGATYEGECQLLALVKRAGLRCEETDYPDIYDICCPNWIAHSPDSRGLQDYPTKTVLYTNGPIGKIECKSSGCQASHPDKQKDYFRHFKSIDVEQTRPLPPLDVHDPSVFYYANLRNNICDKVSLDEHLDVEDATWPDYETALAMQQRLQRRIV